MGPAPDSGCGVERGRFRGWLGERDWVWVEEEDGGVRVGVVGLCEFGILWVEGLSGVRVGEEGRVVE